MEQGESVRRPEPRDVVRSRTLAGSVLAVLLVFPAIPASAVQLGPEHACGGPADRSERGTVRDDLEAPARDPLAQRLERASLEPAAADAVTIRVSFHVIARDRTSKGGWVSDEQLEEQIEVLNASFGGPSRFTFVPARSDRTIKARWFTLTSGSKAERRMKDALRLGGVRRLNVYIADLQEGMLGWASYPWRYRNDPAGDGVLVDFGAMPGGAKAAYDEGDTLVHETGHWLGLFHTFANGCDDPGDGVDDTPFEASPSYGCKTDRDTCSADGLDPVSNFMNYSPDACMDAFTPGQAGRMSLAWDQYRA